MSTLVTSPDVINKDMLLDSSKSSVMIFPDPRKYAIKFCFMSFLTFLIEEKCVGVVQPIDYFQPQVKACSQNNCQFAKSRQLLPEATQFKIPVGPFRLSIRARALTSGLSPKPGFSGAICFPYGPLISDF